MPTAAEMPRCDAAMTGPPLPPSLQPGPCRCCLQSALCSAVSCLPIDHDGRCACLTAHVLGVQAAEPGEPEEAAGSGDEADERGMVHQVMQGLLKEEGAVGSKVGGRAVWSGRDCTRWLCRATLHLHN